MDPNLPQDILALFIRGMYQHCEVCQIHRMRTMGTVWNEAYLLAFADDLELNQPSRGGLVPVGFWFETDSLQQAATVGLRDCDNFPSLDEAFGGEADRSPRVVASAAGIHLIHLTNPDVFILWSPVPDDRIDVPVPPNFGQNSQIGLHVSFQERNPVATRCTLVFAFLTFQPQIFFHGGLINAHIWNSENQVWVLHEAIDVYQGLWFPGNIITIDNTIYFICSQRSILESTVQAGIVQHFSEDVPIAVADAVL